MSRFVRYGRSPCKCCRRMISNCGIGYASHMRGHVKRGEAIEYSYMRFQPTQKPKPHDPQP